MTQTLDFQLQTPLPAAPERVWNAIATGAGNLGWLFPMEIEPWVGGVVSRGPCIVTVWNPPGDFACVHEAEALTATLTYRIEARDGGSVLHTHVHRDYHQPIDDLPVQLEAAETHTDFYHHTLGEYLRHFDGRPATFVQVIGPDASRAKGSFLALQRALGLPEGVKAGDAVRIAPAGLPALDVVVDYVDPLFLGLRGSGGFYRFFGRNHWGVPVALCLHLFGSGVDAAQAEQDWHAWLDGVFA
jgi:hypothetical protein